MLAAYPVFMDLCKLIGKMSEFQDEITLSQLKAKLFDEWGERSTLYHSIDKLIATLKEFGVLSCEKPGKYHIDRIQIKDKRTCMFMAYAMMNIDDSGYYSFQELNNSIYLFPFEYHIEKENIKLDLLIQKEISLVEKLKEYRASIICHAVTGKIDVRNLVE